MTKPSSLADAPVLVIFCGLPGTGKNTLAAHAARLLRAPLLAKDVLEASLTRSGITSEMGSGFASYEQLTALAEAQLQHGLSVVLDSVGTFRRIREEWRLLAPPPMRTGKRSLELRRSNADRILTARTRGCPPSRGHGGGAGCASSSRIRRSPYPCA